MLIFERTPTSRRKVNLTPLIDMVFLLVVFFMLSSSFIITEVMELHFSPANASVSAGNDTALLIHVKSDSRIELNKRTYSHRAFRRTLGHFIVDQPDRTILLSVSDDVTVQGLVAAMDLVKQAGGVNLTLAEL